MSHGRAVNSVFPSDKCVTRRRPLRQVRRDLITGCQGFTKQVADCGVLRDTRNLLTLFKNLPGILPGLPVVFNTRDHCKGKFVGLQWKTTPRLGDSSSST